MKGFILGHGRSGTMWVAKALRACTDLDARHESMRKELGPDFGGVESNGNLCRFAKQIPEAYPGARVIHQVRDGRDVVRSVMTKKERKGRTLRQACERWVLINQRLMVDIGQCNRYRLEDLISIQGSFETLALSLRAWSFNGQAWEEVRIRPMNQSRVHTFPPYEDWKPEEQEMFWEICGETMGRLGYADREGYLT